jgi:Patatin-like phospholipase
MPGNRFVRFLFILRAPLVFLFLFIGIPNLYNVALFRGFADLNLSDTFWVSLFSALYVSALVAIANLATLYADYRLFGNAEPSTALHGLIEWKTKGAIPANSKLLTDGLNPPHGLVIFWIGFLAYLSFGYRTTAQNPQAQNSPFWYYMVWLLGMCVAALVVSGVTWLQIRQTDTLLINGKPLPAGPFLVFRFFRKKLQAAYEEPKCFRKRSPAIHQDTLRTKIARKSSGLKGFLDDFEVGYVLTDRDGVRMILPGHVLAALLFAVSLLLGVGMWCLGGLSELQGIPDWLHHFIATLFFHTSTLVQVLVILTFILWLFGAVSFLIDRYPLAIIPVVAVLVILITSFSNTDHVFDSVKRDTPPSASGFISPQKLIVVSAAGGGIQAAGWTATVLKSLSQRPGFQEHLGVISSVSGGSVGSYAYLASHLPKVGQDKPEDLVEAAMDSSLEVVAWGLAYKDLASLVNPFARVRFGPSDRGMALEHSFVGHILERRKDRNLTPGDVNPYLTEAAFRPRLDSSNRVAFPVWLINSTSASQGRPLIFSNDLFPAPGADNLAGILNLNNYDVRVATAVRMSASFPYVSPAARGCADCDYLVDGGYYDNYGIVPVVTWLRGQASLPDNILVIKIDSFPLAKQDKQQHEDWKYQFIAPLLALYNAKSSGQANRDTQELALLAGWLSGRVNLQQMTIRYSPEGACAAKDPPLSWHLTEPEKECIRQSGLAPQTVSCENWVLDWITNPAKPQPAGCQ